MADFLFNMNKYFSLLCLGSFGLFGVAACTTDSSDSSDDTKTVLATAYTKKLYEEDIMDMVPQSLNTNDSAMFVNGIIERWVREQLFLIEAERKFPTNYDLKKMVDDYKASLVKHHYEQQLLQQSLDSAITQEELQQFYDDHKQDYKLNEPIYRVKVVKISTAAPDIEQISKWLKDSKDKTVNELAAYCNTYAENYILRENAWYKEDELLKLLNLTPKNNRFRAGSTYEFSDNTFNYYLLVLEKVEVDQIPPLSFVEEKAKAVIMQQRKVRLIQSKQDEMYEDAIKNKHVKIYANES